jgi:hypothetical protein
MGALFGAPYTKALLLRPPVFLAGKPVCPVCRGPTTLGHGTTMDWGTDHCKRCKLWWPYHSEGSLRRQTAPPPTPDFATYEWVLRSHGQVTSG